MKPLSKLGILLFVAVPVFGLYQVFSRHRSMIRSSSLSSSIVSTPQMRSTSTLTSSSTIPFTKYQGLGNDFILIDNTKSSTPIFTSEQAIKICNRNFGIGGDGVIFALSGSNGCDYTMRIYNSDGSEPQMCGNGIRCMAKFLLDLEKRPINSEVTYKIWTNAGVIIPRITSNGEVTVDMGKPILKSTLVPTTLPPTKEDIAIESEFEASGHQFKATCVSMGNPHAIIYVDDLDKITPPFVTIGPILEKHPVFPERVNVEFVKVISKEHVSLKVWERGAGPTLACGTGACATAVAGVLTGRNNRKCKVTLPGGDLFIDWNESDGKVYMTGPAEMVFSGLVNKNI